MISLGFVLLLMFQEVLESWPLSSVLDLKAILDENPYDSLLTVSIQDRGSRAISVFLFQSESLRVSSRLSQDGRSISASLMINGCFHLSFRQII